MMNRKLAMALAVSMVVGSLAACGGKTDQAGTTAASKAENAQGGLLSVSFPCSKHKTIPHFREKAIQQIY